MSHNPLCTNISGLIQLYIKTLAGERVNKSVQVFKILHRSPQCKDDMIYFPILIGLGFLQVSVCPITEGCSSLVCQNGKSYSKTGNEARRM